MHLCTIQVVSVLHLPPQPSLVLFFLLSHAQPFLPQMPTIILFSPSLLAKKTVDVYDRAAEMSIGKIFCPTISTSLETIFCKWWKSVSPTLWPNPPWITKEVLKKRDTLFRAEESLVKMLRECKKLFFDDTKTVWKTGRSLSQTSSSTIISQQFALIILNYCYATLARNFLTPPPAPVTVQILWRFSFWAPDTSKSTGSDGISPMDSQAYCTL